jgi:hypothetical protein
MHTEVGLSANGRSLRSTLLLVVVVVLGAMSTAAPAQTGPEAVGIVRGRRLPLLPRRAARMEARGEILTVPLGQPVPPRQPAPRSPAPAIARAAPAQPRVPAQARAAAPAPGPAAASLLEMARAALPGLLARGGATPPDPAAPASFPAPTTTPATRDPEVRPAAGVVPAAPNPADDVSQGSLVAVAGDAARALLVGRPEPFTPAWRDAHPQAWLPADAADWWQPAATRALAARLADAAAAPQVWTVDGQIVAAPPQADGTRSVLVDAAADRAPADAGWLPLGVFAAYRAEAESLLDAGAPEPLGWQQLAVGSDGSIRGNHFDAISDVVQPITGRIDPLSRLATWTVGGGRGARFEAPIAQLTEPAAAVQAVIGGAARPWTLLRLPKPAAVTVEGEPVELLPTPGR